LKAAQTKGVDIQVFSLKLRRMVRGKSPQLLVEVFPGLGRQAGSKKETGKGDSKKPGGVEEISGHAQRS
jgi:hypothetical protein